jgi:hypothetical protein
MFYRIKAFWKAKLVPFSFVQTVIGKIRSISLLSFLKGIKIVLIGLCCPREDKKSRSEMEARDYYDEINKTKYTRERKRELSFLLGSSRGPTRSDSNGSGSSRVTNTSMETGMTNVSSEKGETHVTNEVFNMSGLTQNCMRRDGTKNSSGNQTFKVRKEEDFSLHNLPRKIYHEKH